MTDYQQIAAQTLALIAEYDDRFTGLSRTEMQQKQSAWALQIKMHRLNGDDCKAGVLKAYADPRRPSNPIGAVIAAAKGFKQDRRGGGVSHTDAPPYYGQPNEKIYQQTLAATIPCPICNVDAGYYCWEDHKTTVRPHFQRAVQAMRANSHAA